MGSLYQTNDDHTQERANRVSIAARYKLPLFDVDDDGLVTVESVTREVILTPVLQPIFTVTKALALVTSITLSNGTAGAVRAYVLINPPGVTDYQGTYQIFGDTLEAYEVVQIDVPYHLALNGGVYALSPTDQAIHMHVNGLQFTGQPAGAALRVVEGTTAPPAGVTVYACPAGVREAAILAVTCHNTTAAPRLVSLAYAGWYIFRATLEAYETAVVEPGKLFTPNYSLQAYCDVGAAVTVRPTVLEAI